MDLTEDVLYINYHADTLDRIRVSVPQREEVRKAAYCNTSQRVIIKTSFDDLVAVGLFFRRDHFVVADPAQE